MNSHRLTSPEYLDDLPPLKRYAGYFLAPAASFLLYNLLVALFGGNAMTVGDFPLYVCASGFAMAMYREWAIRNKPANKA